jgi:DegV family protein with EDD domain
MIKIVTDSTAYLPESFVCQHDIRVVPLCVHFGQEQFKEGTDLSTTEFYARLAEASELPTTSQPSAGEFRQVYQELAGMDAEVLTLTISSKLSGTWDSAMAARQMLPDVEIHVVDSLSASIGLQLLVESAVQLAQKGASVPEITAEIEAIKARMCVMFVVDTLEYLAKGGRIGNGKAFLGTLLKVKPILTLRHGVIEPLEQVRSKRKAKTHMLELLSEVLGDDASHAQVAIGHGLVPDEAHDFGAQVLAQFGCREPSYADVGPVIGAHTGPGVIAVAAYA